MHKSSASSLFLMELIIAIFFFSLASTVCIQLFVQSHLISKDSVNLNHAVMNVQNFAESYSGCNANLNMLAPLISEHTSINGNSVELYYDDSWEPISNSHQNDAAFIITLTSNSQNGLNTASIECIELSSNKLLYQVTCNKYSRQEGCQ